MQENSIENEKCGCWEKLWNIKIENEVGKSLQRNAGGKWWKGEQGTEDTTQHKFGHEERRPVLFQSFFPVLSCKKFSFESQHKMG